MREIVTRDRFKTLLRRGHGRAALYIHHHGLASVTDIICEVMLQEPVYDRQFENGRAAWLVGLIAGTSQYATVSACILKALACDADKRDLNLLAELAAEMAKLGDEGAGTALRTRILGQELGHANTEFGSVALVALDGVDAIVSLARRYGNHLIEQPNASVIALNQLSDDPDIASKARLSLHQLAQTDAGIAAFLHYSDDWAAPPPSTPAITEEGRYERRQQQLPLERILTDAAAGAHALPGRYTMFGKVATTSELETVFQRLMVAGDDKERLRLLWVFRRVAIPRLTASVIGFVQSKNHALRCAAFEVLAQLKDGRIGKIGRKMLRRRDFDDTDAEIFSLFIKNFQLGDDELITACLPLFSTDEGIAHFLGERLLDIIEENPVARLESLLHWVYENTPCGNCRDRAVRGLIDIDALSEELALECENDGNDDVRETIANYKLRWSTNHYWRPAWRSQK